MKSHEVSFFKGFSISILLLLSMVAAFNYLIDPYRYRIERIRYLNYLPIPEIDHIAPVKNTFMLHSKGNQVRFSIIGTSHVSFGIPGCDYPFLEKIAFSSMSITESREILQEILAGASVKKTIFIEVCGINDLPTVRSDNFYERIFSLRSIIYSIKTIRTNVFNHQTAANIFCKPYVQNVEPLNSIDELNSKLIPLRPLTDKETEAIQEMGKIVGQGKPHLQHQVIFFIPPLPSETMEKERYKLLNRQLSVKLQKAISSMSSSGGGISFKFINLLDTEIGKEYQFGKNNFYDGWYDGSHFKPIIGDKVIKYLMDHSGE